MCKGLSVISYTLAAIAGICFVEGLAILTRGRGTTKHGEHKEDCIDD